MFSRIAAARRGLALAGALFLGLMSGCGGHSTPAAPVAPVITTQPVGHQTVTAGTSVSFTVVATGNPTPTYQWMKGDANVTSGGTSATYTIASPVVGDAGTYTVKVTNSVSSVTSVGAVLNVNPAAIAPTIDVQPAPTTTVLEGGNATLSVSAKQTDGGTLSYQWKKGTANVGGNSNSLAFSPVALADAGSYSVVVTNTLNGTTAIATSNAAVLTVNALVVMPVMPIIGIQPFTQTAVEGDKVTLDVTASAGNGALSYQWLKGVTPVGGNSSSLIFNPVTLADAGSYTVVVTNTLNGQTATVTSSAAVLTVNAAGAAPHITSQPQAKTVTAPDGNTFSVTATGTDLTYAWKKNTVAINGATSSTYTVSSTDLHNVADKYSVTVTATGGGSIDSDVVTLTVVAPKAVYAGVPTVSDTGRAYTTHSSILSTAPADASGSFQFGYDLTLLNPVWSSACFFPSAPWVFLRPDPYPTDPRIPGSLSETDYTGTGYSRGHMIGFADLRDVYGADAGASTMYMTNMCPTVQVLNGGPWSSLETLISETLTASYGRIWSYSGPIFNTQLVAPVGAKKIPIPTAFYKIVVRETAPGVPKVLAVIVPHSTTVSSATNPAVKMATSDFWKFATTVDRVQALTGLSFFTSTPLPAGLSSTIDVTGWNALFEQGPGRPNVHMITPSWDSTFTHQSNANNSVPFAIVTNTALINVEIPFEAQAEGDPDPIASVNWSFGDGAIDTNLSTKHSYGSAGSYTVAFTAKDTLGHSSTVTRVITVAGPTANTPPTFTPATLPDVTATMNKVIPSVTFTLADDTTAPDSLVVTATSDNQALLPDASIVPVNSNGKVSMSLTPLADQTGSALVTVTAKDGDMAATQKTFTLTVNANNPPTFTPATLADVNILQDSTKDVLFTLADDLTDPASLVVVVTSNNQTLLPDNSTGIANAAGAVTLTLHPAAGQVGTATVTVTATDSNNASTVRTFKLSVNSASAVPVLIISQYYEGSTSGRFIEITNVGTGNYDSTGATKYYLGLLSNPFNATGGTYAATQLVQSLAPGATVVYDNVAIPTTPPLSAITGTPVTSATTINFNGDDILYLTTNSTIGVTGSWAARTDVLGASDSSWTGTTTTTANAAAAAGYRTSWVRNAAVITSNQTFTLGEWTKVTTAAVGTAPSGDTNRLGEHVYTH